MKWTLPKFALILAIALTAWLWPSIFGGKVLLPLDILAHSPPFSPESAEPIHNALIGDMLVENFAWKTFQRECVLRGEWPLWTPYSFCGHPLYTTGQTSTFYPPNVIFWIVPIPYAYVVFTWLHLFMGGIFAWLFFKRVGVGGFGASVGAITFAMCTYFAVRFIWPMLLGSAVWLPLMLLWIDWMADPRSRRELLAGIPAGALLFAMPILSGFFEIAFYAFTAAGLYTAFLGVRLAWREKSLAQAGVFFGKVGAVTVISAGLAAPQLLPFFEVMKRNIRAGEMTYADAVGSGLTWQEALTFAIPDALGNPSRHQQFNIAERDWEPIRTEHGQDFHYFGPKNYVEVTNYVGLLPLAFAALSVLASGRRRLFFWGLLAISLGLALGTPLYWVFFNFVPGTDQVRTPFRWTMLTMFALTYLAAIGADDWYARLAQPAKRLTAWVATGKLLAVALIAVAVVVLLFYPQPLVGWAEKIMSADKRADDVFSAPISLAGLLWMNAARFVIFALGAMLLAWFAYWRAWGPRTIAALSLVAIAFIALDLGQATYRFNTHADPGILEQTPPIVAHLQDDAAEDLFRIGRFGWQKTFYPNLPTLYGLQDYGGYDSIILTDYARYLQAIEEQKLLRYNIIMNFERKASLDSPLLPLLNIRYFLSVEPLNHPDYDPVDVPGNLKLSRLKPEKELPRAFMVNQVQWVLDRDHAVDAIKTGEIDVREAATVQTVVGHSSHLVGAPPAPPGQARVELYRPGRVRVETSAASRQMLVLNDVYYPGWRAYVDGRRTDIIVTNGIFRGVSVPAGNHTVEFRFEPQPLQVGVAIALACLAGLLVIQALLWTRRIRGERPVTRSV